MTDNLVRNRNKTVAATRRLHLGDDDDDDKL